MSDKSNAFGAPDTGHVWDENLRELTNPPPKWWMIGLHASWILVVVYAILYPFWPTLDSHTKGVLNWTAIGEYKDSLAAIEEVRSKYESKLPGMSAAAILTDSELSNYVQRSAKVLFGDNCAACHGAGGQGNPGYPVLADDDWLYGGDINAIMTSITNGRKGNMPAHSGTLSAQELDDVARHVQALSQGSEYAPGKEIFMGKGACFACHGVEGKGMAALGAANLTDALWRFGDGSVESIKHTVANGVNAPDNAQTRNAEMPAWSGRLTDSEIKKLAVYVHQMGGGQ